MADPVERGGWVITMNNKNIRGQCKVDNDTLLKIAEALRIQERAPNIGIDKRIPEIRSIYIYRGD